MTTTATHLIDSNVLIDIIRGGGLAESSTAVLAPLVRGRVAGINPLIYAEVLAGLDRRRDFDFYFPPDAIARLDLPWDAAWHAGQAHRRYREAGGSRTSPMPDFYIGAHALVAGLSVVTRDATRYRTYFPSVGVLTP